MKGRLVGRTAPSASGPPHAGTVFSALLALWQGRRHGARTFARIEDLDVDRVRPVYVASLRTALLAVGYRVEDICLQHARASAHAEALDAFAAQGRLYACDCSRAQLRARGAYREDGSSGYDNACRARGAQHGPSWRASPHAMRLALPDGPTPLVDIDGVQRALHPAAEGGDPIVRRKDGTVAYVLASVLDDVAAGVTQVVRGRDLAALTPQQVAIAHLLGAPLPAYRHHPLLLGADGKKLSKSRGDGRAWSPAQVSAQVAELVRVVAAHGITADTFRWRSLPQHDLRFLGDIR